MTKSFEAHIHIDSDEVAAKINRHYMRRVVELEERNKQLENTLRSILAVHYWESTVQQSLEFHADDTDIMIRTMWLDKKNIYDKWKAVLNDPTNVQTEASDKGTDSEGREGSSRLHGLPLR